MLWPVAPVDVETAGAVSVATLPLVAVRGRRRHSGAVRRRELAADRRVTRRLPGGRCSWGRSSSATTFVGSDGAKSRPSAFTAATSTACPPGIGGREGVGLLGRARRRPQPGAVAGAALPRCRHTRSGCLPRCHARQSGPCPRARLVEGRRRGVLGVRPPRRPPQRVRRRRAFRLSVVCTWEFLLGCPVRRYPGAHGSIGARTISNESLTDPIGRSNDIASAARSASSRLSGRSLRT